MDGLIATWSGLTAAKRVTLVGAVLATAVVFSMLARTASTPSMTLLYAGLDGRAAGDVINALERMDVPFDVRGDSIYVPSSRRDSARMSLAGQGLPQSGQGGYELLDALNGFSTTSDMFDATYWRAKEGEIARTIVTTPGVTAARVHIAQESGGPFSRNASEPTGVVTVTMGRGVLSAGQAQAIQYLVGSAVPGLSPEKVAVLDAVQGVILSPDENNQSIIESADLSDRERKMEADIQHLLEARVGPGNARVQVALDLDMEREAITERVFDPEGRVVSGREINEVTETSSGVGGSTVTIASNLPEGDAPGNGSENQSSRSETREIISYDMSEVRREREKMPGSIRRMSIAVLVNEIVDDQNAPVTNPVLRDAAELDALRELVAQAAGLDEARGDTITVQALPFQPVAEGGAFVEANAVNTFLERHLMTMIQILILGVVTLVLGLFVVKPVLSAQPEPAAPVEDAMEELPSFPAFDELPEPDEPDAIDALKDIAGDKTDEAATLIRNWLEAEEIEEPVA